ncbi:hypothetical protein KBC03_05735 [Patescibacteria group bacterium]|nr:hypothetical protein [Patescibacteria group bacterium]
MTPRHLRQKNGELDYRKIFASIQGYKQYLLNIKCTNTEKIPIATLLRSMKLGFTKKDKTAFRKIEMMCAEQLNMTLAAAYNEFYKPKKTTNNRLPLGVTEADIAETPIEAIDERDIPREDAESNKIQNSEENTED